MDVKLPAIDPLEQLDHLALRAAGNESVDEDGDWRAHQVRLKTLRDTARGALRDVGFALGIKVLAVPQLEYHERPESQRVIATARRRALGSSD